VNVTSGLLLCAIVSAVGVVLFARVRVTAPEPDPVPALRSVPAGSTVPTG
jgi:hypothetical protein